MAERNDGMPGKRWFLAVGHGVALAVPFLVFLGVSYLISLLCGITAGGSRLGKAIGEFFLSFLLLYSTSRIAAIGDPVLFSRFLKEKEPLPERPQESVAFFLRERGTHLELALVLAFSFLLPVDHGLFVMGELFFSGIRPYVLRRLLTAVTAFPLCFLAQMLGKMTAVEYFRHCRSRSRRFPLLRGIAEYIGVAAVYLYGAYIAPGVLSMLGGLALFLVSFPALLVVWLLVCLLRFFFACLRVFRARRRLYRRLRAVCAERGYELTRPCALYRAILLPRAEVNFTIKVSEGEIYDCLVVSTLRKRRFLFFDADGIMTAVAPPRRGTAAIAPVPSYALTSYYVSAELFSLLPNPPSVSEPYAFSSENRKIIIVTPAVWRWYSKEGTTQQIEPGAGAFGYKFYNAETLLGLLEREALDRDFNRK